MVIFRVDSSAGGTKLRALFVAGVKDGAIPSSFRHSASCRAGKGVTLAATNEDEYGTAESAFVGNAWVFPIALLQSESNSTTKHLLIFPYVARIPSELPRANRFNPGSHMQ